MRIAVIGGGTAGYLAAAHVSHHFPTADLYHVFDRRIPPIGVGEGTLPQFPGWINEVIGVPFEELEECCLATFKLGIRFENWGKRHPVFFNNFARDAYAYHISASRLPRLLERYVRAERRDCRVMELTRNRRSAALELEGGETLEVDFAFDARGFPRLRDHDSIEIPGIPTNAALTRRTPAGSLLGGTRAVARPHGWIFGIPLTSHISLGYVHDARLTPVDIVRRDFDEFLRAEETTSFGKERLIRFPNFRRTTLFDGVVFRIGNAASFIEPLEATAIGMVLLQLQIASYWLKDSFQGVTSEQKWHPEIIGEINRRLIDTIDAVALFVAWHYERGSAFHSDFWLRAQAGSRQALGRTRFSRVGRSFRRLRSAGSNFPPSWLSHVRNLEYYDSVIAPNLKSATSLAGFDEVNFAQIGFGLGCFDHPDGYHPGAGGTHV